MFTPVLTDRPHQGDIFQKLQFKFITEDGETETITFPFWIIMTQECDLDHDYNAWQGKYKDQDKCMQTILACPAFLQDQLKAGTHMQNLSLTMETWGSDNWKKMRDNHLSRFHAIASSEIQELPNLIIDFKRVFTFPREYIYSQMPYKVASMAVPYREQLAQRFAYFSSRVALPDDLDS